MLYDFEDLTFQILTIKKLRHNDGSHNIKGRPFASLAFRLSGEADFEIDGKTFKSKEGDVCFIPQNVSYVANYSRCEYIVVHFKKCNYKKCENFSTENTAYFSAEFQKLLSDWQEKHSMNRAKSTIFKTLSRIEEEKTLLVSDTSFLKAARFIEENFCDPDFDLSQVTKKAGISEAGLRRKFHEYYNVSPKQYLIKLRLGKAVDLLVASDLTIKKIAEECGFSDEKYFSRIIKETYNQPPSAFKGKTVT
jgi:AraC-like DNA-binding protein